MSAQTARDYAQQDAPDHALQRRIVVQEIARPFGTASTHCRTGNGGNRTAQGAVTQQELASVLRTA